MNKMKHTTLMLTAAMALVANTALAHPDHDDVPPEQALKLELARKKDGAMVYLTNDGHKVSTVGATGTLSYTAGGNVTEVVLKPTGVNGMAPVKAATIVPGTKARATVTTAEKTTVSSEFLVK
ncbi:hypothetical protein [Duganella vulcania]|uniref:Uncharacterized protein n=1 Tax=Duganella vulcania TaxID=2692166 RepID=A0A845GPH8_9BURK|nr:hypothetical protein [Duganella vulcania]MYM96453.1 hypothetical protein [Duganella vulcania]